MKGCCILEDYYWRWKNEPLTHSSDYVEALLHAYGMLLATVNRLRTCIILILCYAWNSMCSPHWNVLFVNLPSSSLEILLSPWKSNYSLDLLLFSSRNKLMMMLQMLTWFEMKNHLYKAQIYYRGSNSSRFTMWYLTNIHLDESAILVLNGCRSVAFVAGEQWNVSGWQFWWLINGMLLQATSFALIVYANEHWRWMGFEWHQKHSGALLCHFIIIHCESFVLSSWQINCEWTSGW